MKWNLKHLLNLAFLVISIQLSWATHNRAGEITYRHLSGFTYEFTVVTYTKLSGESEGADRPKLEIFWGDGTKDSITRISRVPTVYPDVFKNTYKMAHSYTGPSRYIVSMTDPNRIDHVINMQNSVNTPFYIEDTVRILNPNDIGYNNSPILFNDPLDAANVGQKFVHNPNAFDPDGDSLVFSLIPSKQSQNLNVSGYLYPNQIEPGINNQFTIDSRTGQITWIYPQKKGTYNIAILIREYRNGFMIGTVVRDMQIFVDTTINRPPVISVPPNICVIAGDSVNFSVSATDPDVSQKITLSSNGTVYDFSSNPAQFSTSAPSNPASGTFRWLTDCSHLNKNEFPVLFKAQDNYDGHTTRLSNNGENMKIEHGDEDASPSLVDLKTVFIRVLAPAPKNVMATPQLSSNSVTLKWDSLYVCSSNARFRKFSVWKKIGCGNPNDSCNTDLKSQGYQLIGYTNSYTFIDNALTIGNQYSYKIKAEFADLTTANVEINSFSSLPSEEVCVRLPLSLPVLYNVDVKTTDINTGKIYIEWSRPNVQELDTLINAGIYSFILYRAENSNPNFTAIATKTFSSYSAINDTSFLDINLNTENNFYTYKLQFVTNTSDTLGFTNIATSVFLHTNPNHKSIDLNWTSTTPWQNTNYVIYRKLPSSLTFDSIATTTSTNYTDTNLMIDSLYCYKIKAIGTYNLSGLKTPLINFSQESCAIPVDTISPCMPTLILNNFCLDKQLTQDDFINYLVWTFDTSCDTSTIVKSYIYFQANNMASMGKLDSLNKGNNLAYTHDLNTSQSVAGCYKIEVVAKNGKKTSSNLVCSDDCPIYELPNTFTPNGDGQNDLFTPILPYRSVEKIEMKIYNRWGNLVFETDNPDINWNGTDYKNGKELPSAVYFYSCYIYYKAANKIEKLKEPLSGYIHLFR